MGSADSEYRRRHASVSLIACTSPDSVVAVYQDQIRSRARLRQESPQWRTRKSFPLIGAGTIEQCFDDYPGQHRVTGGSSKSVMDKACLAQSSPQPPQDKPGLDDRLYNRRFSSIQPVK